MPHQQNSVEDTVLLPASRRCDDFGVQAICPASFKTGTIMLSCGVNLLILMLAPPGMIAFYPMQ